MYTKDVERIVWQEIEHIVEIAEIDEIFECAWKHWQDRHGDVPVEEMLREFKKIADKEMTWAEDYADWAKTALQHAPLKITQAAKIPEKIETWVKDKYTELGLEQNAPEPAQ